MVGGGGDNDGSGGDNGDGYDGWEVVITKVHSL